MISVTKNKKVQSPPLAIYNYIFKKKTKYENGMSQIDNRTDAFKKFAVSLLKKTSSLIAGAASAASSFDWCFIHGSRNNY